MSYGELKIDTITFTAGGVDASVSVSGLVQNPTFTGNITTTGTISGDVIRGNTVSGATVTGDTGEFGNLTAVSGVFTTQVSGATVTGNVGLFGTITGGIHTLTSGVFASGTQTNPSITFVDDLNTGIYSPGADQVAVATNGVGRLLVDSTGVITTEAGTAFSRFNIVNPNSVSTFDRLLFLRTGNLSNAFFGLGLDSFYIASATAASMVFCTNSDGGVSGTSVPTNERMRLDSSGRLLVGTTSSTGSLSNTAPVIAGLFQSFDDVATFTTGVAKTLFAIPNASATYIVTLRRGAVGDAANYEAVSILSANSGTSVSAVLTDLKTAANVLISISGTNLQGTQSSGGNASLRWIVTRVG